MLVDQDAVVHLESGVLGEVGVRGDADADKHEVSVETGAVTELDSRDATVRAGDGRDLHAAAQVHLVVEVQVGEDLSNVVTENTQQGQLGLLEDSDVQPGRARSGRRFQADPAGPDDDDPGTSGKIGLEQLAVFQPPEISHTIEVGAGEAKSARS